MKRLRCVRALGERSLKWQGLIKSIFVVRNNTSVRGEITERGRQYPQKIITLQILPLALPPATARPQIAPSPGGLSDSSAEASVPCMCHAETSAGSR